MWPLLLPKNFSMKDLRYVWWKKRQWFFNCFFTERALLLDLPGPGLVCWVSAGYSYDAQYIWHNDPETLGRRRQKKNKQKKQNRIIKLNLEKKIPTTFLCVISFRQPHKPTGSSFELFKCCKVIFKHECTPGVDTFSLKKHHHPKTPC